MSKIINVAQKAIVQREVKGEKLLLMVKYKDEFVEKNSENVVGKYGCPGGRIEFGEDLDRSLEREVKEETGITVKPLSPIGLSSWIIKKGKNQIRIVAIFRLAEYMNGKPLQEVKEGLTIIERAEWLDVSSLDLEKDIIKDEIPVIRKVLSGS